MRYGKPIYNEDDSLNRVDWHIPGKIIVHPVRGRIHRPVHDDFISCGYLPEANQIKKRFEDIDLSTDICLKGATEISHPIVQQDINIIRQLLKVRIESIADSKVHAMVPARKVRRFNAKANRLNRKAILHLKDPQTNPDLTPEEELLISQLEQLEETAETILEAEDAIVEELNEMLDSEVYDLEEGWEDNHPNWP